MCNKYQLCLLFLIIIISNICRKNTDLGGFKAKVENGRNLLRAGGNFGGLGKRPLKHVPFWCFLLPKLEICIFFSTMFLWQGDSYTDQFSLRANSTLHLSKIVILFSEWEYFKLFLLIKLTLLVVKKKKSPIAQNCRK